MSIFFLLNRKKQYHRDLIKAEKLLISIRRGDSVPDLEAKIRSYLNHPHWEVRNVAVKMAGDSRLCLFIDPLTSLLTDRSQKGFIRRNAATALRMLSADRSLIIPSLIAALTDPYWEVRTQAAEALAEIADPDATIEQLVIQRIFRISPEIIHSLPYFFPGRVFRERNFEVRAALTKALGTVAIHQRSIHVLEILLGDNFWQVRESAITSLFRCANRLDVTLPDLRKLLKDLDLTCPDFRPNFPIRETWNRLKNKDVDSSDRND